MGYLARTKRKGVPGKGILLGAFLFMCNASLIRAHGQEGGDGIPALSLPQCITYALQRQPGLRQSIIGTDIVKASNAIGLSGWYPQVGITGNFSHYFQRPTTLSHINGVETPVQTTVANAFAPGINVTQNIFSPSLIYAGRVAPLNLKMAEQIVDSSKIDLVANVSKSYYSLLLTLQQINVLKEDAARLAESMRTAYHQYVGGIVDETATGA